MKFLSVKNRITLGLVFIVVSSSLVAVFTGFGPNARRASLHGRAMLCESIAINSSLLISRNDIARMEAILAALVARHADIVSAGIRRADGSLQSEVGDHQAHWDSARDGSTETHVQVPLRDGSQPWGSVELRFTPLQHPGWWGVLSSPWGRHTLLVAGLTFLTFNIYLGKVLKQLDPSKAIPKRVRPRWTIWRRGCW